MKRLYRWFKSLFHRKTYPPFTLTFKAHSNVESLIESIKSQSEK